MLALPNLGPNLICLARAAKDPAVHPSNIFGDDLRLSLDTTRIRKSHLELSKNRILSAIEFLAFVQEGYRIDFGGYKNAMRYTELLFFRNLPLIEKRNLAYRNHLTRLCKGYEENLTPYRIIKENIADWHHATEKFFRVYNTGNKKLQQIVEEHFTTKMDRIFAVGTPYYIAGYKWSERHFAIIQLEGKLGGPLPYRRLMEEMLSKKSENRDLRELRKWAEIVVKKGISVRIFHRAMSALVDQVRECCIGEQDHSPSLEQLEYFFFNNGCDKILLSRDEKHIKWRKGLGIGSVLYFQGKRLTIEKKLGEDKDPDEDRTLVFQVEELQDKVVLVGINEAILGLKLEGGKRDSYGTLMQPILGIDGPIALAKKMKEPFKGHKWTSTSLQITDEDRDSVLPLARTIQWLLQEDRPTPMGLHIDNFMFDHENRIRALKVSAPGERHDFNALEAFAWECALGNKHIFSYIVDISGLKKSKWGQFYKQVFVKAIYQEVLDIRVSALSNEIDDQKIINRALALYQESIALFQNYWDKHLLSGKPVDLEKEKNKVRTILKEEYDSRRCCGILPDDLALKITG